MAYGVSGMPNSSATPVPDLQQLGIHHDFIKNAVHEPVRQAPQQVLSQLPDHALDIPRWYSDASDAQREALKEIQALNNVSLTALNTYLNQISSVEAFAKPLLTTALFTRFGIECDVDNNIISQTTLNSFTQEVTRTTTQTLLQAALHNFEDSQATAGGIPEVKVIPAGSCAIYRKDKAELAICSESVVQWGKDTQQVRLVSFCFWLHDA